MKIIFLLPTGMIEWPVPDELQPNFDFQKVVATTRMNGFFAAERLYLRHEAMLGMGFHTDEMPAPVPRGTLQ